MNETYVCSIRSAWVLTSTVNSAVITERAFEAAPHIGTGDHVTMNLARRTRVSLRAPRSSQKRLLLLTTNNAIGGMERTAICVAREFTRRKWTVRSIFAAGSNGSTNGIRSFVAWCREQGVEVETHAAVLPITAPHTLQAMLALRRLTSETHPSVVNIHYGSSFISLRDVLAVRMAGVRHCVATVHHPEPWTKTGQRKRIMTRISAYLCSSIIVPSHAVRDVLLDAGIPKRKIHVIYNGVPMPASQPNRSSARTNLRLPQDAFVISTLARLDPHKGIADLIEAAALVPDPLGKLRVVIAGDGVERTSLEELAALRLGGRAMFLGRVPDTASVYAASDVFVLPSHLEGFGLVYIEAAFHGVPSIGTNVGGVPDAILDGKTGLLVPPGDPPLLAASICRLRDDPKLRLRLGLAAKERAESEFTEARMADQYEQVFYKHPPE